MDAQHAEDADAGGDAQIEMPASSRFMVFEREADRAAHEELIHGPEATVDAEDGFGRRHVYHHLQLFWRKQQV